MKFKRFLSAEKGDVPIVLSVPHGGFKRPKNIHDKETGVQVPDRITYFLGRSIIHLLQEKNIKIYYIMSKLHRIKLDLNRPPISPVSFNPNSKEAQRIHLEYHRIIQAFAQECVNKYRKCLFIDLHGFTRPKKDYPDLIFGHIFGNTLTIKEETGNNNPRYWGFSEFIEEFSKHFELDDGLALTDFNLAYSGGYITHRFYGKCNINAFQFEIAKYIRFNRKLFVKFLNTFITAIENALSSLSFNTLK
ncbi:MAG: N-formylglutamate amidohydrolase [Promethearchaeota archaeon]